MKSVSTLILKIVIVFVALAVLTGMLWFPQTEGRAANLDLISIYSDPLIIYIYVGSTPFFLGLFQAFKLLNLIEANQAFSQGVVNTLKNMKYSSLCLICSIVIALLYIHFFAGGDDPAGPTALGILTSLVFATLAAVCSILERLVQSKLK